MNFLVSERDIFTSLTYLDFSCASSLFLFSDYDEDCIGPLKCFQRDDLTPVPGCSELGRSRVDYCYLPPEVADETLVVVPDYPTPGLPNLGIGDGPEIAVPGAIADINRAEPSRLAIIQNSNCNGQCKEW